MSNEGVESFQKIDDLYRRYGAVVYRRARTLLGDDDRAWDVVQEIFMQLLGGMDFRGESTPTTWLYRITTNRCLNLLRDLGRRARRLEAGVPSLPVFGAGGDGPLIEGRIAIQQLAQQIEPDLCELAIYAYVDCLPHEEIGQLVGLSRKTVGQRLRQFCERAAVLLDQPRKVTA